MPQYRIYHLDGAGQVGISEWLDAAGDEAAIRLVCKQEKSAQSEVWLGRRLVTRIDHKRGFALPPAPAQDTQQTPPH